MSSEIDMASPFSTAFQILVHATDQNILGILSLMKSQGLAKSLANPTLVTMTGQEATFQVGGSFPIPVTDQQGNTQVDYVEFGIILSFTPVVVRSDTITLKIAPEVSAPDYGLGIVSGGVAVPGLKKNLGSTTLQLKDGQTFVMAGLLKEDLSLSVSTVPFLGDIPVLGALFTSKQFRKQESEIVVVVTPHLVEPLPTDEELSLPGEDLDIDMNDTDFFLLNAQPRKGKKGEGPEFSGERGFAK
jgi:pilus assembly protein CpaC